MIIKTLPRLHEQETGEKDITTHINILLYSEELTTSTHDVLKKEELRETLPGVSCLISRPFKHRQVPLRTLHPYLARL